VDAASVVFKMGEDKVLDVKDHIVKMSLSWDFFDGMKPVDMDAACVCFDSDGKFLDICFYNRLSIYDGVITHSGDSRDGKKDGWDEQITVDLTKAADKCQVMVFSVLIHGDGNFINVESSKAALLDTDGQTLVESWFGSAGEYTAHTFSVLYYSLDDYEWHYREINANSGGRSVRAILPVTKRAVGLAEPRLAEAMEKTAYHGEMDTLNFFKCIVFQKIETTALSSTRA
jgi:tellurium resistance protein TerZ